MMQKRELKIDYAVWREEFPDGYGELCRAAREAASRAYCPYSRFAVGAAVLLDTGRIVTGSNQENAAYPSGLCAERVALFAAGASCPRDKVVALAIASPSLEKAGKVVAPCGACRQVMQETLMRQGTDFDVIMLGASESLVVKASSLLPFAFELG